MMWLFCIATGRCCNEFGNMRDGGTNFFFVIMVFERTFGLDMKLLSKVV